MAVGIEHSPSSTSFQRFKLLVWKSYLWHRYYWWWSIIEIIARCSVALYLGLSVKSDIRLTNHGATYPHSESRSQLLDTITSRNYLAYSPPSKFTDQLMLNVAEKIKQKSGKNEPLELLPFDSERVLAEYVVNRSISMKQEAMGVIFDNIKLKDDNSTPPNKLVYELRQSIAGDTRWLIDGDSTPGPYKKVSEYWSSGFVALQLLINEEFIGMKLDKSDNSDNSSWSAPSGVVFQPFPYPEYETSMIDREHLLSVIVLTLIATEVALSVPYIASIIFEKQNGVKNLMTVYLVEESLIWLGWFLKAFVVVLISATLTAIFLKTPFKGHGSQCVRYTDFSVLWSFLILFHASNICFVLFLSSVFNRATIAALVHMFTHYLSLVLLFVTLAMNLRSSTRLFWPSTSYSAAKGIRFLATAEVHGIPFNWATALTLHANESAIIYLPIVLFFVFDVAFYSLLMLLFGFINSGDYGSKRSPLFIFSFLFFGTKHKHTATESHQVQVRESETRSEINKTKTSSKVEGSLNTEIREPVSPHHEPSIRIEGLHKEYNNVTHALERIDLEFYDNEITVLLGPKDAGKTTLLSILAGSITYDDGFIHYKGIDVSDNLDILKNDLGICFKEDRLFHYLSVKQHLMFFGRLKGLSKSDAEEETEQFLIKLEMHDEQNSAVKYLSQVLKRKLCIAIGLIGGRKVLILDEPMEGLDHKSKIKIWNLLSDMRTDRTIIISTSNAREAESLADRVAILENGFVIAHGTPKYLRNNIGIHYEILVSTKKEHFNEVTEKVKSSVSAKMVRELDNEIVYSVHPSELPKFSNLFLNLEQIAKELEISNIGVSFNSIEHVMMKTGGFSNRPPVQPETTDEDSEYDLEFHDSIEGLRLRLRQMRILLGKKILYMFKDYANILKRIILPSLIAVLLTRLIEEINFNPYLAKKLSPSIYVLRDEMLNTAIYPQIMLHKKNANQELVEEYSTLIATRGGTVAKSGDSSSTESLLNYGRADLMRFRRELLAAFDLTEAETSKIAYNLWTIHSLPIAVSIYSNVLLRRMLNDDTAEITTINHPLPTIEKGCDANELFIKALLVLAILYITFAFLTMDVVLYLFELSHKEIVDGLMYLQIMSGVPRWMYWFATFVFDFIFFVSVLAFRLALFTFIDNGYDFFRPTMNFALFVVVIVLFGISGLFCVYVFSFFYKPVRRTYYAHVFMFNFACNVCVTICYSFSLGPHFSEKPYGMYKLFSFIFLLFPFLNFPWTVLQYFSQWYHNNHCFIVCSSILEKWCIETRKSAETRKTKPYLEFSNADNIHEISLEVAFLLITLIFAVILFILINSGLTDFLHNFFNSKEIHQQSHPQDDEEIRHEREEIQRIKRNKNESKYHQVSLVVDGLGKSYIKTWRSIVAVEDVSFVAEHGTSFGILGGQEAGKTTIFHMMAAKIIPTKGSVSVEGMDSRSDRKQFFSMVGYCPQTSPLIDKFTGRQMLKLIVSLKGIKDIDTVVDEWIAIIGLEEIQNVRCDLYSNSSKRLLSTALSLVGNPRVVFLDEPAHDVDSMTRHHLYDIIEHLKHSGMTVVLGSSSSHECELLCDRLTILINGVMYCIGNTHDLKDHHSLGYFLMIRVHPDITSFREVVRLEKSILAAFKPQSCRLIEEYRSLLHYQIVDHSLPLSSLFLKMEEIKSHNPVVEEYIVTTTTIQDILESFSHPANFFSSRKVGASAQISEQEYQKDVKKIVDPIKY